MDVLGADALMSPRSEPSDGELVKRARDGDREAFAELVRLHQRRIWMVCRQYLNPGDADAATQDAFVKAYTSLSSFDGRAAFTTWLTRIAINTCLDELRRQRRQGGRLVVADEGEAEGPLEHLVDDGAGPEERAMQQQAFRRLVRLEEELPDRQREIFRLRFYAELELGEIATVLGVHVGTVKTQLHRAVHRLRQELGELR